MPLLEVKNLSVCYGTYVALKNISIEVGEQEIVALIGSNGAGKTTLMTTILGLLKPLKGEILFESRDITLLEPEKRVSLGISLCPEGRLLFPNLTVYKNLVLGFYSKKRKNKKELEEKLQEVFELFPILKNRLSQLAGTMSGGEQQMLAIARSLMSSPKLLLLDEPTLGLSPKLSYTLFETLKKVKEKTSILLSEQNAYLSLEIADRAYVIELGEIKMEGNAKEIKNNPEIKKSYFGI